MPIARLAPRRFRRSSLTLLGFVCFVLSVGCSPAPGPDDGSAAVSPEMTVTATAPAADSVVKGSVTVSGNVKTLNAPKNKKITCTTPIAGKDVACTVTGNTPSATFSCPAIDTTVLDASAKPLFKEGSSLTVTVTCTAGDASNSDSRTVKVDNQGPVVVIDSPVAGGVYIRGTTIKGHVEDKNLTVTTFTVVPGGDPFPILVPDPKKKGATSPGPFKTFEFKWQPEDAATHPYTLTLHVEDGAGNASDTTVDFTILQAPAFAGDNAPDGSALADGMTDDIAQDLALGDLDGDGILDAVVAAKHGVIARQGVAVGDPAVATGRFLLPPFVDPGKTINPDWRFQRLPDMDARKVLLTDLDGDLDLDVLVVGVDAKSQPAAWALLNVSVKPVEGKPDHGVRLVLVDTIVLPSEPFSAALVELNPPAAETEPVDPPPRSQPDLVVGAKVNNKGLTTVLLNPTPVCDCGKAGKFDCGTDQAVACVTNAKTPATATIFPKDAKGVHTIVDKGVTGITSIAVGDFYKDDKNLDDVCVGEEGRARVSCYRNFLHNGALEQAQDSYALLDDGVADSHFIMTAEWTSTQAGGDGPDLIVSTHKGFLRWLRGKHDGTFGRTAGDPEIIGPDVNDAVIINNGPGGTPYLYYNELQGREVTQVPLFASKDMSLISNCFRTWVVADGVVRLLTADVDGDSHGDLISLDKGSNGVQVTFGSQVDVQNFVAPTMTHVCSQLNPGVLFTNEVAQMVVADFTKDQKPELLLIGIASKSWQQGPGGIYGACPSEQPDGLPTYKPVWTFSLSMNDQGAWQPAARIGEFAPYYSAVAPGDTLKQNVMSGASVNCPDAPKAFGSVVGAEVADMNNDGLLDLVTVRSVAANYAIGTSTAVGKCGCLWGDVTEKSEVDNLFGLDAPDEAIKGASSCCKIFNSTEDKKKINPLKGYGDGAPLDRASLHVWLNTDPAKPFGLGSNAVQVQHPILQPPPLVKPTFAQAGGLDPVAVAVRDLDGDKNPDVVTTMHEHNSRSDTKGVYLQDRLRIFKGLGTGKLAVAPQKDVATLLNPQTALPYSVDVSYVVVDQLPISVTAAPFCSEQEPPNILTLNGKEKSVSLIRNLGGMKFSTGQHAFAVGEDPVASMSVRNVNGKDCADVLVALKSSIALLPGVTNGAEEFFAAKTNLVEGEDNAYVGTDVMDANGDGLLDLVLLDGKRNAIDLYLGDGKGGFVKYAGQLLAPGKVKRVVEADVDGDGCIDLVVQSTYGATYFRNQLPPDQCVAKLP
jgi:hypothetical protein